MPGDRYLGNKVLYSVPSYSSFPLLARRIAVSEFMNNLARRVIAEDIVSYMTLQTILDIACSFNLGRPLLSRVGKHRSVRQHCDRTARITSRLITRGAGVKYLTIICSPTANHLRSGSNHSDGRADGRKEKKKKRE